MRATSVISSPTRAVISRSDSSSIEGGTFERVSGSLRPAPSAPVSEAMTMLSIRRSCRSVAYARFVSPCVVSVQTSSWSPKSAGTRTLKMKRLRRGRKRVGWPRSAGPGEKKLSVPTGTSISSSQFRFM